LLRHDHHNKKSPAQQAERGFLAIIMRRIFTACDLSKLAIALPQSEAAIAC
jgi:hypothetical protein